MPIAPRYIGILWLLCASLALARPLDFPYREAGLSPQEAANHLLQRFSYGPLPGQVEEVSAQGLEAWVSDQFLDKPDPQLEGMLSRIPERSEENAMGTRKLLRAVHGHRQMREVMADFWFNHLNVSLTDPDCRPHVAAYERQVILPHCLGSFRSMLVASSQHPAMLYYLDNAYSAWEPERYQAADRSQDPFGYNSTRPQPVVVQVRPGQGLNENYARELLELHTLGVNGGYRQQDVTELARILTGWSVEQNSFLFRPERHDPYAKRFLFQQVNPSGQDEGLKILEQLASHSSTARFIARKFAVRFVSDRPPASLELRLSRAFQRSQGNSQAMIEALLQSPEFWKKEHVGAKIKSPLELLASSLRILDARLSPDSELAQYLGRMGQELYACRPPTGWPDRAETWLTPGNLVQRLSFAHLLASQQVRGVQFDKQRLKPKKPVKNANQALQAYAQLLLPGRDNSDTIRLLQEAAADPGYSKSVIATSRSQGKKIPKPKPRSRFEFTPETENNILGLLLGCPQFQRR